MSIISTEMKKRFQQRKDNTVTSVELVDIINNFRKDEGKTELRHNDFMTKIRKELETLTSLGLGNQRNFSLVKYTDKKGEERPCFELNHDGMLEMLNSESAYCRYKTIEYINNLKAQIEQPKQPQSIEDLIIMQAQSVKALKEDVQALKAGQQQNDDKIQGIRDVVAINSSDWKADCKTLIVKISTSLGGFSHIQDVYKEVYSSIDRRFGTKLSVRLTNKRRRMADEGVCKSRRDKLNYIDVIADDKKLVEGYVAIVKELAIKYGVA